MTNDERSPKLESRKLRLAFLFLGLAGTVGCDQTSKHMARAGLSELGSLTLPGGFGELRLAENPGSFLSVGASLPESVRLVFFTVGVGLGLAALLAYLVGRSKLSRVVFVSLALVLAGGMSNLIDRITRQGLVTDFIFLRVGPFHTGVFNLADLMIMSGVATLACAFWKGHRNSSQTRKDRQE